jgi:predicted dehydrogenase
MRYDQSMRVLKQILDKGELGDLVFAEIDMHAIPHWQTFLEDYDRLTLANMSVHHLDVLLRFLFGEPTEIFTTTRTDPHARSSTRTASRSRRSASPRAAGAVAGGRVVQPARGGLRPTSTSRGGQGPRRRQGTIGWPTGAVSTLSYASTNHRRQVGDADLGTMWFPHAFKGRDGAAPARRGGGAGRALTVDDNVKTVALIEAGYTVDGRGRIVKLSKSRSENRNPGGTP